MRCCHRQGPSKGLREALGNLSKVLTQDGLELVRLGIEPADQLREAAAIEGGLSWPIEARLMEPYFVSVFLKDFRWEQTAKGWQPNWCRFGEGTVNKAFFANLKKSAFAGPLCQHHEYDHGAGAEMIANFKRDLTALREWLATA